MALPVLLFMALILGYSIVLFLLYLALRKVEPLEKELKPEGTRVSIIIPFRCEKENLPYLVQDLQNQSYRRNHFEVLFVNDHSDDGSIEELTSILEGETNFHCLSLPEDVSGKKAAIFQGVRAARYERIIQVDADCRMGRDFIASHAAFLEKHPADLVAGLVLTSRGRGGMLEAYEGLDLLALSGVSAGSFALGRPMMCSGANLSYTRKLFMETRHLDPVEKAASGDDMFLMIGARKLKKKLAFITAAEAIVTTSPVKSFGQLLSQRIRWGAKSVYYAMMDIQALALLVTLSNLGILLLPVWYYVYEGVLPWLAMALLIKSLADLLILSRISGITRRCHVLWWYLPSVLLYYPVFLISLAGAMLGKSRWK